MNPAARLSGVFAPVVTPFRSDDLDLEALRGNLRRLAATGLSGYLALGSNGEFRSLGEAEEQRVLDVFAREKAGKLVMVGVGCESTRRTVEKACRAAAMGFDFASVLTPHYFPKNLADGSLHDFFSRVADGSPIPILLYNAPGFTGGVAASPACALRLAAHPNIVGMKDSSAAGPGVLLAQLPEDASFAVLAGSAGFLYPSLLQGASGGVLSMANYLPDPCCELYRLCRSRSRASLERAAALHRIVVRLNGAVSGRFGVPGVKAAMDLCGFRGGEPRHPLRTLSEDERETVRHARQEAQAALQEAPGAG